MGNFPYTDVSSSYDCEAATGDLLDATGNPATKNLIEVGTVPSVADGMFGKARGPVGRAASSRPHFSRSVEFDGSQYDVQGLVSVSVLMWIRLTANTTEPFGWSVWGDGAASEQAWVLSPNVILPGPVQGPRFHMYDGTNIFTNIGVYATTTGADIALNVWHLIGGSWDAASNLLACFWGDGSDPTGETFNYSTVAGFVAGWNHSTDGGNNIGRFTHGGIADVMEVDHLGYWKGRAFNLNDFLNHWQLGTGLLVSEFATDPGRRIVAVSETATSIQDARPIRIKD